MKRLVGSLCVAALLALPVAARAQAPAGGSDSARRAMTAAERRERREERRERNGKAEAHPEIRAAIRSLDRAKLEFEHASHDFGGHRADALKSVDESIRQLRLALQSDKK